MADGVSVPGVASVSGFDTQVQGAIALLREASANRRQSQSLLMQGLLAGGQAALEARRLGILSRAQAAQEKATDLSAREVALSERKQQTEEDRFKRFTEPELEEKIGDIQDRERFFRLFEEKTRSIPDAETGQSTPLMDRDQAIREIEIEDVRAFEAANNFLTQRANLRGQNAQIALVENEALKVLRNIEESELLTPERQRLLRTQAIALLEELKGGLTERGQRLLVGQKDLQRITLQIQALQDQLAGAPSPEERRAERERGARKEEAEIKTEEARAEEIRTQTRVNEANVELLERQLESVEEGSEDRARNAQNLQEAMPHAQTIINSMDQKASEKSTLGFGSASGLLRSNKFAEFVDVVKETVKEISGIAPVSISGVREVIKAQFIEQILETGRLLEQDENGNVRVKEGPKHIGLFKAAKARSFGQEDINAFLQMLDDLGLDREKVISGTFTEGKKR